ncbi:unnamed protein product [Gadus morhua 'NCC']
MQTNSRDTRLGQFTFLLRDLSSGAILPGREPRIRGGVVKVPGDLELSDSDPEDPGAGPPLDAEVRELNSSSEEEEEEEVATVRCGRPLPAAPLSNFSLKGGNSSFSFRSRNIFDCLDTVAKETSSPGKDGVAMETASPPGKDGVAMETASPPGKDGVAMVTSPKPGQDGAVDGVFVRPSPPPPLGCGKKTGGPQAGRKRHVTEGPGDPVQVPARRGAPDYLLHPERWTRYSLEEVAETSDSRNRSVALQYLLSLQQSQEPAPGPEGACFVPPDPSCAPAPEGSVGPSPHRIIFSRPGRGPGREERGDEGRAAPDGGGRRGGLSHLQEEEEEEDLDCSTAAVPPKVEQRKRKMGPGRGGGGLMEEEEEEEKSEPEVAPEFASFRKAHRKNYRKTSEQEDE